MPNMSFKKVSVPEQNPSIRNKNFEEVCLGYNADMAIEESERCLNCKKKPCVSGCPVNVDIPAFINKISKGDFNGAYNIIYKTNFLPAICGRVCPQESQCESKCIRGIKGEPVAIGRLERFVADYKSNNTLKAESKKITCNGHKIAVIGSGPSGLACTGDLLKLGYKVTIFEALHTAGGVLVYGIPQFRLPKKIVKDEISNLIERGADLKLNTVIGKTVTVDELMSNGFEAVYIASGAGLPKFMGIPGENFLGVYSANEFLTRLNLMKAYDDNYQTPIMHPSKVCVFGGGNVAMDAARSAKRLGADNVYVIYRRSENEMPARKEEIEHAKEEGIEFILLANPVKILSDKNGYVNSVECVRMELSEPDESGRRRPVEIVDSNFKVDVDCVIVAIGNSPNQLIEKTTKDIKADSRGCLVVDNIGQTTKEGVYAGGDAVTGAATVILAMGAGKKAAAAIDNYIKGKN